MSSVLSPKFSRNTDSYGRLANDPSVGQIDLHANPLLEVPLGYRPIKPRLPGHGGTNFIHVHLKQLIKACDLNTNPIVGPGRGRPEVVANVASMRSNGGQVEATMQGYRSMMVCRKLRVHSEAMPGVKSWWFSGLK